MEIGQKVENLPQPSTASVPCSETQTSFPNRPPSPCIGVLLLHVHFTINLTIPPYSTVSPITNPPEFHHFFYHSWLWLNCRIPSNSTLSTRHPPYVPQHFTIPPGLSHNSHAQHAPTDAQDVELHLPPNEGVLFVHQQEPLLHQLIFLRSSCACWCIASLMPPHTHTHQLGFHPHNFSSQNSKRFSALSNTAYPTLTFFYSISQTHLLSAHLS